MTKFTKTLLAILIVTSFASATMISCGKAAEQASDEVSTDSTEHPSDSTEHPSDSTEHPSDHPEHPKK